MTEKERYLSKAARHEAAIVACIIAAFFVGAVLCLGAWFLYTIGGYPGELVLEILGWSYLCSLFAILPCIYLEGVKGEN